MRKLMVIAVLCLMVFTGGYLKYAYGEGLPFAKAGLEPVLTRPDMVVLIPNGGVVFVYRDKYGAITQEEYFSVRVQDQGIGLCDDVGTKDVWLFTGGGYLLHKEDKLPKGLKPYWRYLDKDQSFLHNEKSTRPKN